MLRILDGELRLITPTDPEGQDDQGEPGGVRSRSSDARYYQLTHDYLVPSLREWPTRRQKETRRCRAELLLADRAAVCNAHPGNRQLPSLWQWLQICLLTRKKTWTPPQRKMMPRATRYHVVRGLVVALLLALIGWGSYEGHGRLQAHALRGRLLDANTNEVPGIVEDMAPYRRWLDPLLHDDARAQAEKDNDSRKQLHASLALLPVDATQVEYLYGRLLDAEPGQVPVIRDALTPHKEQLVEKLWAVVESPEKDNDSQRLRAAAALANYDPESQKWAKLQEAVGNDLVTVPAVYLATWVESLRPVREKLLAPLAVVYRDGKRRETERSLATDILADYAADQLPVLADLLMDADEKQFAVIYPKFQARSERGLAVLTGEIDQKLPSDLPSSDERREKLAKRQANAAVALLRLNQPEKLWPLLRRTPPDDPRVRSYLIDRLSPLGADAGAILQRLDEEPDLNDSAGVATESGGVWGGGSAGGIPAGGAGEGAGAIPHGGRSGLARSSRVAAAEMEAGGMAETGERGLGQGPGEAGRAVGDDSGTCEEGPGEDAAAVVRQQPGADDGGDPRSGGVHDGITKDRSGTAGSGDAT
jgi:hypothetical protein